MLSSNGSGLLDTFESKVQEKVAEFLALREKLRQLKLASDPTIRSKATKLYEDQLTLQSKLDTKLASIKKIKAGEIDPISVYEIGKFVNTFTNHIDNSNKLIRDARKSGELVQPYKKPILDSKMVSYIMAAGAALYVLPKIFRKVT